MQYNGADSAGSICLTYRFLIGFNSSVASVLAIVSEEFIKYVNGVRESGFALILGSASSTPLNRNYFSIYHVLKRMFFLQSILVGLLQPFAFHARELLLTVSLSSAIGLVSHYW